MSNSNTNISRRERGDSRNIPSLANTKRNNQDWIKEQAGKLPAKVGAELTGMSERAFENLRLGRNKISFDNLTEWMKNDADFAAAYVAHVGLILPGQAEFAGALTRAFNAYQRLEVKP